MIAPSTRHVPFLLGLAALLALPIARNGFEVQRMEDCANPPALLHLKDLPATGAKSERYEAYDEDLRQWTEWPIESELRGVKLRAALIRSFRPIDLYSRPPRRLLGPVEAGRRHVEWVEVDGARLPIQTFFDASSRRAVMASYLFVYGDEPVEHPAWAQLQDAPRQVWSGTRPLTLLMVGGDVPFEAREAAREQAKGWIVEVFRRHREICSP